MILNFLVRITSNYTHHEAADQSDSDMVEAKNVTCIYNVSAVVVLTFHTVILLGGDVTVGAIHMKVERGTQRKVPESQRGGRHLI